MRKQAAVFLAILLAALAAGCRAAPESRTVYAMDTVMTLTAYGAEASAALSEAEEEIFRLDKLLSRFSAYGETAAVNGNAGGETAVSEEFAALTALAQRIAAQTRGAFDPTVAPAMDAWGFGSGAYRVPAEDELAALLPRIGAERIVCSDAAVSLGEGQALDFGGIAKGYAGGRVKEIFAAHGCTGTLDLGGDVVLVGAKEDGSAWRVAVKDPNDTRSFLGTLTLSDCAVVTSGVYERYFTEHGVRYHHILDPRTARPAESGLVSVTVVCADSAYADALSTAAFVLGAEGALAVRDALKDEMPFELLLVTEDGRVRYTAGLDGAFRSEAGKDYVYELLH